MTTSSASGAGQSKQDATRGPTRSRPSAILTRNPDETAAVVPAPSLAAGAARPAARRRQPVLLAARPADLPARDRPVRDALRPLLDARVPARRQPAAARGRRRRVRVARGQELPGLLRQRGHPAARGPALLGRHPALARAAVPAVRGPAQRRDARQAAEGAGRRRAADDGRGQRAVPDAGRRRVRGDLRVQRALADRARSTSRRCRCSAG